MIEYDTAEYARSRLVGTCVKLGKKLVYVEDISDGGLATLTDVSSKTTSRLEVSYKDLDISPLNLGYTNKGSSSYYVMRAPKRNDWKQGTRFEQLIVMTPSGSVPTRILSYKDLCLPALNKFPKIAAAYNSLVEHLRERQAFSRDFCLADGGDKIYVEYKGVHVIGTYDGSKFSLESKYQYLKERLSVYES